MHRPSSSWLSTLAKLGFTRKATRGRAGAGNSGRGRSRLNRFEPLEERLALYASTTLVDNGPVENRIDMVFVGDGFTSGGLTPYVNKVADLSEDLFLMAPFDEYASYFNIHRVDVISAESGIDQLHLDPPVYVDTALGGKVYPVTDRGNLFGVDDTLTETAAVDAPDSDFIEVILNGSGRANAPGNMSLLGIGSTSRTFLHELGHTLGDLGDEYVEFSGSYTGSELTRPNLTTLYSSAEDMIAAEAKWYRWLTPDHPEIGVFEGANYYPEDVYRPSNNSIMRSGTEFDVVGREALIVEMYKHPDISTIDDATPAGQYYDGDLFVVTPMAPDSHSLDIQWYVDDEPIEYANGTTFDPGALNLPMGEYTVRATVVDNTDMVRDEEARAAYLTDSMEWTYRQWIQVTTEADENGSNPAAISLREAIALAANETTHPGVDKIVFASNVVEIVLGGELLIDTDIDIVGPGWTALTIDADGSGRVFDIAGGNEVSISGATITGGDAGAGFGGGILSEANLTLRDLRISGNYAYYGGGISQHGGNLTIARTTIADNQASVAGGIYTEGINLLDIEQSTISGNEADYIGGLSIYNSNLEMRNSTISGNSSMYGLGAGVFFYADTSTTATLTNVTIAENNANTFEGGGIYINERYGIVGPSVPVVLNNSIVADNYRIVGGNPVADDIAGEDLDPSSAFNLIGSGGSGGLADNDDGNIVLASNEDAGLAPLGDYGGPTKTHALLITSPAIDHGSDDLAVDAGEDPLLIDQLGYGRFYDEPNHTGGDGTVDMGAVEFAMPRVTNVIMSSTVANSFGTNPPYEFADHDGSEEQLRTIPVGGLNRISIQFSKDVLIDSGDLHMTALNRVVSLPSIVAFEEPNEANGNTATWTFDSTFPFPAAQWLIQLFSNSIDDLEGYALDGEWTNPGTILASISSSTFPSGNQLEGGDFEFVFTNLQGDTDRDLDVDLTDYNTVIFNLTFTNKSWAHGDFSGNGVVDLLDYINLTNNFGFNYQNLKILGDYDDDFDVDLNDFNTFSSLHGSQDPSADLNKDSVFDSEDFDAFYERYGLDLDVLV